MNPRTTKPLNQNERDGMRNITRKAIADKDAYVMTPPDVIVRLLDDSAERERLADAPPQLRADAPAAILYDAPQLRTSIDALTAALGKVVDTAHCSRLCDPHCPYKPAPPDVDISGCECDGTRGRLCRVHPDGQPGLATKTAETDNAVSHVAAESKVDVSPGARSVEPGTSSPPRHVGPGSYYGMAIGDALYCATKDVEALRAERADATKERDAMRAELALERETQLAALAEARRQLVVRTEELDAAVTRVDIRGNLCADYEIRFKHLRSLAWPEGLDGRLGDPPTPEQWVERICAVLDSVGPLEEQLATVRQSLQETIQSLNATEAELRHVNAERDALVLAQTALRKQAKMDVEMMRGEGFAEIAAVKRKLLDMTNGVKAEKERGDRLLESAEDLRAKWISARDNDVDLTDALEQAETNVFQQDRLIRDLRSTLRSLIACARSDSHRPGGATLAGAIVAAEQLLDAGRVT